jgi:hypothetical protein
MEPILIKKGKTLYAFYSDKLVITKKDKAIHEIHYDEIKKISYNPKFGFKDFMRILASRGIGIHYYFYNAFTITLKVKKSNTDIVFVRFSNDEFEEIKDIFGMSIELI